MLLKSTTRHVQIYAAEIQDQDWVPSESALTINVDPDNEFNWTDGTLKQVYQEFERLVADASGADLTDYNLRRMGSDLEHFIRGLLQSGAISYNVRGRVMNYSMGLPQVVSETPA